MNNYKLLNVHWDYHQSTLISAFATLRETETLVDCTLGAEGKFLKAHKMVLAACSPYFAALFKEHYDRNTIILLKDVTYQELRALMDYMYRGDINISQDQLEPLLKVAESLQIKGLCAVPEKETQDSANSSVPQTAAAKRKSAVLGAANQTSAGLAAANQTSAGLAAAAVISKRLSSGSMLPTQQKPWIIWRINKITKKPQLQTSDANNNENVPPQGQGVQGAASGGVTPPNLGAGACAGAMRTMDVGKQLTADVGKSSSNRKQTDNNNDIQTIYSGSTNCKLGIQASSSSGNRSFKSRNEIGKPVYECQQCGSTYTRKECLRRHVNFECFDKEPRHLCPYCPYKSKQSGNLGVHMRRYHADRPVISKIRRAPDLNNMK